MSRPVDGTLPDVWTRAYDQVRAVREEAVDAHGGRLEIVDLPEPAELGGHSDE